jgi:hypothetical protein
MEVAYSIGGSVASSEHGIPRTTLDVDLVVDLRADQIEEFAALLHDGFYADAALIRESFSHQRAANVIHYETGYKFDLFPLGDDDYSRTEFQRRAFREIRALPTGTVECAVASAEDTILRKLDWYRRGHETSERQWNDLRGIVNVNRGKLDLAYLRLWAPHLRVADLLEKLLSETAPADKRY